MRLGAAFTDRLLQLEDAAGYTLAIDVNVDSIGAHSECTRAQVVYALRRKRGEDEEHAANGAEK
jgi:hypothetical protein